MQVTIEIPDVLAAKAQARGLKLDHYLPTLLAKDLSADVESQDWPAQQRSMSEAIDQMRALRKENTAKRNAAVDAMRQFADKHGFTTGGQELKSIIHEGHKY